MAETTDIPLVLTEDERSKVRLVLNKLSSRNPKSQTQEEKTEDLMPNLNTKTYLERFSYEMYTKELDEVPNLYLIRRYLWKYLNRDITLSISKLKDLMSQAGLVSEVFQKRSNGYHIHAALETPCFAVKSVVITVENDGDLLKITQLVFCGKNKK